MLTTKPRTGSNRPVSVLGLRIQPYEAMLLDTFVWSGLQSKSPGDYAGSIHTIASVSKVSISSFMILKSVAGENFVPVLPRAHRIRNRRGQRKTHRNLHIPERKSILERPEAVQHRRQAGHWETDTVVAQTSCAALLATVERKSRYTKLAKLARRTAQHVRISLNRSFSRYPKKLRRTITYDNGQENVEHMTVNKTLGTRSYFCQPYHSWEKGTVENTIGIIRRTFPKKTNFDLVSSVDVKRLERKLNNTPRKILNYQTPKEVFDSIVALPH